ncbi:phrenate dehydratase [Schizosaccharomyces cryophilus OY26]|uniref:Phrenate dehydratase n=1 Tax=Schizosaccharomyces cryophilus (strain OY26 / ATCC MYA-4695 / CBS 11777 / NBRC 106824 / NRRL Y48691) TaxID=653667 RepID=S9W884_SCHCR|nr:phrenate dehydratase [Schizosaccharomyces cryophilus OY26]EPY53975.1 phrenate dehydratase [Schizosaccharomyces cryophilus OY26]
MSSIKVGFLGPKGTFSNKAALLANPDAAHISLPTLSAVVEAVESRQVNFGLLPIENSTNGSVIPAYDLLKYNRGIAVLDEILVPVHHCIIGHSLDNVSRLLSHPQAFGQCTGWIKNNLPGVTSVPVNSTSHAAEMASKDQTGTTLAISSQLCADTYNYNILVKDVEDDPNNCTRFLLLASRVVNEVSIMSEFTREKKAFLQFTLSHPKKLNHIFRMLLQEDVIFTNLVTRPSSHNPWTYVYFIECVGLSLTMLLRIESICDEFTVMGNYENKTTRVV